MTTEVELRHLTLVLRQDAALGGSPTAGRGSSALSFMPGSMLRGALAAAWMDHHGPPVAGPKRSRFLRLFESEVQFGPLFTADPPRPLSVHRHKRQRVGNCVAESDWAVSETPVANCGCGSVMEQSRGEIATVATKRRSHVEIGADGTAVDKKLFSRTVVSSRDASEFKGTIFGPAELLDELAQLASIRVGGRTSTHGASRLIWASADEPTYGWPRRVGQDHIVLRLASPGIFVDDFGRACPEPNATELSSHLGNDWSIVKRWVRWEQAGGWHAASGLPKAEERCVAAGSTYLVKANASTANLQALGKAGLGLRRVEGFGVLAGSYEMAVDPEAWWSSSMRFRYMGLTLLSDRMLQRLGDELLLGDTTLLARISTSPSVDPTLRAVAEAAVNLEPWQLTMLGEYMKGTRK